MFSRNLGIRLNGFYRKYGKRIFDLVLSVPSFIFLSPVFIATTLLIKLETPGPIFFIQERVGRGGKIFKLYKFRTMIKDASNNGPSLTASNDKRITKVGKLLRKYKIDELIQIINVIKGDMSVIGPRPEYKKYIGKFKEEFKEILKIKPGMTDYALIAFRNEEKILSKFNDIEYGYINKIFPLKVKLYGKYAEEISFATDVKIFFKTIWEILSV